MSDEHLRQDEVGDRRPVGEFTFVVLAFADPICDGVGRRESPLALARSHIWLVIFVCVDRLLHPDEGAHRSSGRRFIVGCISRKRPERYAVDDHLHNCRTLGFLAAMDVLRPVRPGRRDVACSRSANREDSGQKSGERLARGRLSTAHRQCRDLPVALCG